LKNNELIPSHLFNLKKKNSDIFQILRHRFKYTTRCMNITSVYYHIVLSPL